MPNENQRELRALCNKARRDQWRLQDSFEWSVDPKAPNFLMKRFAGRAVGALIAGEKATAGACDLLIARVPPGPARDCLEMQAIDEERHAEAYTSYLERIGIDPQPHERISIAVDRLMGWSGPTAGLIFAVHIVLESEALGLQLELASDIDCPLYHAINQRITQDEARHVAFGRLIAAQAVAEMDEQERQQTVAEIQSIWVSCVKALAADNFVLWRALSSFADRNWKKQLSTMESLGLVAA
jgi:hypothetical protein